MPKKPSIKGNEIVNSDNQTNLLSTTEKTALTYHENVIEKGLETFIEVGQSLQYIRDNRLYRGEFTAFDDYMSERWGKTRAWASNMIKSVDTMETLKKVSTRVDSLPESESQARPLAKLKDDPELMAQVWEDAVAEAKMQYEAGLKKTDQPTHKEVEAKVKEYEQKIKELEETQKSLLNDQNLFINDLNLTVENQHKQIQELNISVANYENSLESLLNERHDLAMKEIEINDLIAKEADLKASEILQREHEHLRLKEQELDKKEKELSTQLKSLKKNQSEVETAKKNLLGFEKWIEDLQRFNCFIKESTDSIISTTKNLQNLPDLTILTSAEKDLINPRISSEIETFWNNAETFGNAIQKISQDLKKLDKQVIKSIDVEVVVNE